MFFPTIVIILAAVIILGIYTGKFLYDIWKTGKDIDEEK